MTLVDIGLPGLIPKFLGYVQHAATSQRWMVVIFYFVKSLYLGNIQIKRCLQGVAKSQIGTHRGQHKSH